MLKPIATATAIAGTLDILAAFVLAAPGPGPVGVLQTVASGPLGDIAFTQPAYAAVGLLVHFAIMACMATAYVVIAARQPRLVERPVLAGLLYGVLLWIIMYWIFIPLRWSGVGVPHEPTAIAGQLFCHLLLVGIPIAAVAARFRARR